LRIRMWIQIQGLKNSVADPDVDQDPD